MIPSVQPFVIPRQNSFYIGSQNVANLAASLDRNRDGRFSQDELQLTSAMRQLLDTNRDNQIQLFELTDGLQRNQISLQNFGAQSAHQLAGSILRNGQVFSEALGTLGRTIDSNRDGFVNQNELAQSLSFGQVFLSGNYLVGRHGQNGSAGWARETIQTLETQKMKKDRYGRWDPSTGLFTPDEANKKINAFLNNKLLPSQDIPLSDKLSIFKDQIMAKDRYGRWDPSKGSLTADKASSLARQALEQPLQSNMDEYGARNHVQTLRSVIMEKDQYGRYKKDSGLLTHDQANERLRQFFNQVVLPSQTISSSTKLTLIRSEVMSKDQYGRYDKTTGSLTPSQAQELSRKIDF